MYSANPTFLSLYTYATTCLFHPLYDGNGRLARFLAYAAFARCNTQLSLEWKIEAAFATYRNDLVEGLRILGIRGNWELLANAFVNAIELSRVI